MPFVDSDIELRTPMGWNQSDVSIEIADVFEKESKFSTYQSVDF